MIIESTLTKRLYARILILLILRSWGFRLFVIIALFAGVMSRISGDYLLFIIYFPFVVLLYAVQVLRAVMSSKNRNIYVPARYKFEEARVTVETSISKKPLKWDAFVAWKRVGQYYLIYASRRSFLTIPKSRIPAEGVGAFEALLSRKIRKK
jgi:hypothetical protein